MSRIDVTYFTGFRNIPNVNQDVESANLTASIDIYEEKFFIEVFGYEFQKLLLASPTDPIYQPILEGVEFTNSNGELIKWEGVNNSIANYVYFNHIRDHYINYSGAGFSLGANKNSSMVNPYGEMIRVWNLLNPSIAILEEYLIVNSTNYPTLEFTNYEKLNRFGL